MYFPPRREKTRRWETSFISLFTSQTSYLLGLSGPQELDSYRIETQNRLGANQVLILAFRSTWMESCECLVLYSTLYFFSWYKRTPVIPFSRFYTSSTWTYLCWLEFRSSPQTLGPHPWRIALCTEYPRLSGQSQGSVIICDEDSVWLTHDGLFPGSDVYLLVGSDVRKVSWKSIDEKREEEGKRTQTGTTPVLKVMDTFYIRLDPGRCTVVCSLWESLCPGLKAYPFPRTARTSYYHQGHFKFFSLTQTLSTSRLVLLHLSLSCDPAKKFTVAGSLSDLSLKINNLICDNLYQFDDVSLGEQLHEEESPYQCSHWLVLIRSSRSPVMWSTSSFYDHDDDTSTAWNTESEQLQLRWISRDYSLYLGTLGGGKDMRETRVERTELTWLLIAYFWVILIVHIVTSPLLTTSPEESEGCWGNSPAKTRSLLLKMLRNSIRDCNDRNQKLYSEAEKWKEKSIRST